MAPSNWESMMDGRGLGKIVFGGGIGGVLYSGVPNHVPGRKRLGNVNKSNNRFNAIQFVVQNRMMRASAHHRCSGRG